MRGGYTLHSGKQTARASRLTNALDFREIAAFRWGAIRAIPLAFSRPRAEMRYAILVLAVLVGCDTQLTDQQSALSEDIQWMQGTYRSDSSWLTLPGDTVETAMQLVLRVSGDSVWATQNHWSNPHRPDITGAGSITSKGVLVSTGLATRGSAVWLNLDDPGEGTCVISPRILAESGILVYDCSRSETYRSTTYLEKVEG